VLLSLVYLAIDIAEHMLAGRLISPVYIYTYINPYHSGSGLSVFA
jgi:hypothetical protein